MLEWSQPCASFEKNHLINRSEAVQALQNTLYYAIEEKMFRSTIFGKMYDK